MSCCLAHLERLPCRNHSSAQQVSGPSKLGFNTKISQQLLSQSATSALQVQLSVGDKGASGVGATEQKGRKGFLVCKACTQRNFCPSNQHTLAKDLGRGSEKDQPCMLPVTFSTPTPGCGRFSSKSSLSVSPALHCPPAAHPRGPLPRGVRLIRWTAGVEAKRLASGGGAWKTLPLIMSCMGYIGCTTKTNSTVSVVLTCECSKQVYAA